MRLRTSRTLVVIGIIAVALLLAVLLRPRHRTDVPEFRGVVLDARTGAPIAGATVIRKFYKPAPSGLVDTSAPDPIRESRLEVTTDSEGRFAFPPFSAPEISGMAWLVFTPGFMTASGCYGEESWAFGGCSGFGPFMSPDPWRKVTVTRDDKALTFEIRLFPPITEGIEWPLGKEWTEYNPDTRKRDLVKHFPEDVDPWGEYFRRLNSLSREGWLPEDTVIIEAEKFVEGRGRVTVGVLDELAEAGSRFGGHRDDRPCYKAELAWRALDLRESVCQTQPTLRCDYQSLATRRSFLERKCPSYKR